MTISVSGSTITFPDGTTSTSGRTRRSHFQHTTDLTGDGGAAISGMSNRPLPTTVQNDIAGVTVNAATGVVTVANAGLYRLRGGGQGYLLAANCSFVRDAVSGTVLAQGTARFSDVSTGTPTYSSFDKEVTLSAGQTIRLSHWANTARATNGLGVGVSGGVANASPLTQFIYGELILERIA